MRIKKTFQGTIPENKILNEDSTSQTDTYSCAKINEMTEEIYSTEETVIGKWIDGKPLYRKVVEFGTLPNATQKGVEIGSGLQIKKIYGYCYRSSDNTIFPIPYVSVSNIAYCIQTTVSNNVLYIKTSDNWPESTGTIILEYTKTTDYVKLMKKIILKILASYIILILIYLVHSTSAMIIYDIREYYNEATECSLFR